jgi:UDP-N-acetylmuramoyl-tripeptide--D-alanyl-D-alanine ligase
MTALWTHDEAAAATGGENTGPWQANGVSIDSRSLAKGDLFIAIKGDSTDGHAYVGGALRNGAAAAMVTRAHGATEQAAPLLLVDDTDAGLRGLGRAARDRAQATFIGVTGSVGKTGTKEMIASMLETRGPTARNTGNLNNHWGLPLSLARMPRDSVYGVYELGMNHAGEIAVLSDILRPDIAVITTVESVHLEFFPSEDAIADAKGEIFSAMDRSGAAVLNRDNRHYERLRRHAEAAGLSQIRTFGSHDAADVRLVDADLASDHSTVRATIDGAPIAYTLGAPGRHLVLNSLAAITVAQLAGADPASAAQRLAGFQAMTGRGMQADIAIDGGSFRLIDESYNASPASMRAAFDVLGRSACGPNGRRIAVLGDMLEVGATAPDLHAALAPALVGNDVAVVIAAGKHMKRLVEALPESIDAFHGPDSDAIRTRVLATIRPGDVVMVKGSLGSKMVPIAHALRELGGPPGAGEPNNRQPTD